jgi:ribosome-associated protein
LINLSPMVPEDQLTIHRFPLQGEFIELNLLLKLLGLAPSGGAAKALIAGGAVTVDGEAEARIRRKLRAGQVVRLAGDEIHIDGEAAINMEPRKRRTAVTPSPGEGAGEKAVK